jgi:hypothetical protein
MLSLFMKKLSARQGQIRMRQNYIPIHGTISGSNPKLHNHDWRSTKKTSVLGANDFENDEF